MECLGEKIPARASADSSCIGQLRAFIAACRNYAPQPARPRLPRPAKQAWLCHDADPQEAARQSGRVISPELLVLVLSLYSLGAFTAYVASFFLEKAQRKEESEIHRLIHEVRKLREQVERLVAARPGAVSPPAAASPATPSATGRSPGGTPG